ncbi:hypothetical protein KUH03_39570 [Sphingobacterium sp. E70]|uniref:hypothetical protein n=1 Tax=Sphingobacterium sp. E70 TaxID=2853439 RepID=UPI00211CBB56|nr:hypothetical protein [Sphingobacterium sp. E70]ULT24915.1 hypothetical protein KUH03_39570 [Sphingobacterium sp. E70]
MLILLFSLRGLEVRAQLFDQDSLKLISRQFAFTEGPAVDKDGISILLTSLITKSGNTIQKVIFLFLKIQPAVPMDCTLTIAVSYLPAQMKKRNLVNKQRWQSYRPAVRCRWKETEWSK